MPAMNPENTDTSGAGRRWLVPGGYVGDERIPANFDKLAFHARLGIVSDAVRQYREGAPPYGHPSSATAKGVVEIMGEVIETMGREAGEHTLFKIRHKPLRHVGGGWKDLVRAGPAMVMHGEQADWVRDAAHAFKRWHNTTYARKPCPLCRGIGGGVKVIDTVREYSLCRHVYHADVGGEGDLPHRPWAFMLDGYQWATLLPFMPGGALEGYLSDEEDTSL